MIELCRFLEDVEARIDAAQEKRIAAEWENFVELKCTDEFFSPHRVPAPPRIEWPRVPVNHAFHDMNLMLYTQLKTVSDVLEKGGGLMLCVRSNYGTPIIPSVFGTELLFLPDDADMLPGALPLPDGVESLRAVVEEHNFDFTKGLVPRVFEFGERWKEAVASYPNISRYVHLYNPDLQGPFPLVDSLTGSDLYYALFDEPELVHEALDFMTEIYIEFTRRWQERFAPYGRGYSVEWGLLHKGLTVVRNDAIVNISESMYREFAMPYDARVYKEFGGCMHFCGKGDHFVGAACEIEGVSGINMSQPELNDMEKIYRATVDQGKIIIGMPEPEIARAGACGRPLRGLVHSGAALSAYRNF